MVTVSRLFTLSLISLPFVVLYAELANRVQESAATMQLRQEVGNLRFRLDYETSRLQRMIDDLQRQVRQRVQPPVSTAPLPALRPVPSEVSATSARRLRVHDAAGRPRGAITVSDRFGPMVALMGRSGDVEAMLSVPSAGPRLELFDRAGRLRIVLGLDDGTPELRLLGEDGSIVGRLGAVTPGAE